MNAFDLIGEVTHSTQRTASSSSGTSVHKAGAPPSSFGITTPGSSGDWEDEEDVEQGRIITVMDSHETDADAPPLSPDDQESPGNPGTSVSSGQLSNDQFLPPVTPIESVGADQSPPPASPVDPAVIITINIIDDLIETSPPSAHTATKQPMVQKTSSDPTTAQSAKQMQPSDPNATLGSDPGSGKNATTPEETQRRKDCSARRYKMLILVGIGIILAGVIVAIAVTVSSDSSNADQSPQPTSTPSSSASDSSTEVDDDPWATILSDTSRTEIDAEYGDGQGLIGGNKALPTELGLMAALTKLSLSGGPTTGRTIGELPTELGLLTKLTYLRITNQDLSGTTIPSQLGQLTQLNTLWISNNYLSGKVPSELGLLTKLSSLVVSYGNNLVGTMPSSVCALKDWCIDGDWTQPSCDWTEPSPHVCDCC